jgi:hypothetical protein
MWDTLQILLGNDFRHDNQYVYMTEACILISVDGQTYKVP